MPSRHLPQTSGSVERSLSETGCTSDCRVCLTDPGSLFPEQEQDADCVPEWHSPSYMPTCNRTASFHLLNNLVLLVHWDTCKDVPDISLQLARYLAIFKHPTSGSGSGKTAADCQIS